MALNKGEGAGTIYLSVSNGKLVRQFKEATKESAQRTNKTGRIVHEEFYKDLTGIISKIETKENDYGKQWHITFMDDEQRYMVQMPYSGRYASSFLKCLPNATQGQPVRFMPWEMQDKNDANKKVTGVTIYQNDGNGWVKIPSAYTKEEPNGLPEMTKAKVKGKVVWDGSEMMEFLENIAVEWGGANEVSENKDNEEAPF